MSDKHITIIDDLMDPLTDEQYIALVEWAKAHPELGKNVVSLPFQPIDFTGVYAALNDIGGMLCQKLQPIVDAAVNLSEHLDALYLREYGMTMHEYFALQEYFEAQQWDVDWEEE